MQSNLAVKEMLERVLRLPAVASKRYLTNKVCLMFVIKVVDGPVKVCLQLAILLPTVNFLLHTLHWNSVNLGTSMALKFLCCLIPQLSCLAC